MANGLTVRQRDFAQRYAASGDVYRSALAAGYSEGSAREYAKQVLRQPAVAAYVRQLQAERASAAVDPGRVWAEVQAIAFADMEDYVTVEDGRVVAKDLAALPPEKRAAIAFVKEGAKGVEVKLYDKTWALEKLGKAGGLFSEPAAEKDADGPFEVNIRVVE